MTIKNLSLFHSPLFSRTKKLANVFIDAHLIEIHLFYAYRGTLLNPPGILILILPFT